ARPEIGADKRRLMPPPLSRARGPRRRRTHGQSPHVLRSAPTSGASCRRLAEHLVDALDEPPVPARSHGLRQAGAYDEHVVLRRRQRARGELRSPDLAELPLDPVSDDRVPRRARYGESEPRLAALIVGRTLEPVQRQKSRRCGAPVAVDSVEVARAGEAVLPLHRLRAEALAALRAAALENQAAGARRHPGA